MELTCRRYFENLFKRSNIWRKHIWRHFTVRRISTRKFKFLRSAFAEDEHFDWNTLHWEKIIRRKQHGCRFFVGWDVARLRPFPLGQRKRVDRRPEMGPNETSLADISALCAPEPRLDMGLFPHGQFSRKLHKKMSIDEKWRWFSEAETLGNF